MACRFRHSSMTYGELKRYILFHRDFEKRQYQNLSQIAYIQAGVLLLRLPGRMWALCTTFSLLDRDDVLDIQAAKAMATLISFND